VTYIEQMDGSLSNWHL